MGETSIDESRIKDLIKQAMLEVLQERRDLISELFAEAIEDLGLTQAIREGESTESVSRAEHKPEATQKKGRPRSQRWLGVA